MESNSTKDLCIWVRKCLDTFGDEIKLKLPQIEQIL